MIQFKSGNIFDEDVEALVNTVNCVGVMGRGIALQFKKTFPENYKAYAAACKRGEVKPGQMFVYEIERLTYPRYIINFPTKRHWRTRSRLDDIESGLEALANEIHVRNIHSIAIPPLGSGLGGLDWTQVRKRVENSLAELKNVNIVVFEPKGAPPPEKITHHKKAPSMTKGRAALIELIDRYLSGLLDPFITLLELHKLMYFMQEAGEPLRLEYKKGPYGPYAEQLRHLLNRIEGYFVSGYADGGDSPDKQLKLLPGIVENARSFLKKHPMTNARFERVADLIDGFESTFGLELLATVHWVIKKESVHTMDEVIHQTYKWNERKKQFSPRQITIAAQVLKQKGWIEESFC